jgi:hypothetical protein
LASSLPRPGTIRPNLNLKRRALARPGGAQSGHGSWPFAGQTRARPTAMVTRNRACRPRIGHRRLRTGPCLKATAKTGRRRAHPARPGGGQVGRPEPEGRWPATNELKTSPDYRNIKLPVPGLPRNRRWPPAGIRVGVDSPDPGHWQIGISGMPKSPGPIPAKLESGFPISRFPGQIGKYWVGKIPAIFGKA